MNKTEVIRYSLQALVLVLGSTGTLFFGLMGPIIAWFNPVIGILWFLFAGGIAFGTVELVDQIDKWADGTYITT